MKINRQFPLSSPERSRRWTLIFLSLLFFQACGGSEESAATRPENFPLPESSLKVAAGGRQGGTLNYMLPGEPSTFNLATARNLRDRLVTYLTTATLLEFDAKKQVTVGGVVKNWTVSEDTTRVTLHLREGLRFSDGEPFDSDDVIFSFQKIFAQDSKNPLKGSLMVGGKPLTASAIDALTVEIVFPEPYAAAEYLLTTVPVFPQHLFEGSKPLEDYWNLDTAPEKMAGLGPFRLVEHLPGQRSVFRYNPHYWRVDQKGQRLPYLDEIVIFYVEDRDNQILRFEAGELDLLDYQLRPEDYLALKEEGTSAIVANAGPSTTLTFCWFNLGVDAKTNKPFGSSEKYSWFSDINFRRAVDAAISRDTIVENVFLGQATAASGLVPSSIPTWHDSDIEVQPYNPERARELLRQSGFSWQKRPAGEALIDARGRAVEIELLTRSDDVWGRIAAVMQQDLEKIGIKVSIKQEETRSLISRVMGTHDYDLALMGLNFSFDPSEHRSMLLSSEPMHVWNPAQESPATDWERRIDQLMFEQVTTLSLEKRQQIYREVQSILVANLPILPLLNSDVLIAYKPRLKGIEAVTLFPFALWNVWELWVEPS